MSANSSVVNELNNALLMITGSGANEVVGGSYVRVSTTWGAIAAGSVTGSQVTINVPAGTTITSWGLWTLSSGGLYVDGGQLPTNVLYSSAGTYLITVTL